jgi:phosphoribosylglycinamide formyltransferase-1
MEPTILPVPKVTRLAIFVSGRGTNLRALLEAKKGGKLLPEIVVVFSNRSTAPAVEIARSFGVPVEVLSHHSFSSREEYDKKVLELLSPYSPDGAVFAGYMRIVTSTLIHFFPAGILNLHPALLPAFPGVEGVRQAWEYGVKVTGCTVHFVDEKVDHGPIVVQKALEVKEDDTVETLSERIRLLEHASIVEAVNLWAEGKLFLQGRRVLIRSGSP